jgi:hypothetical protein
MKTSKIYFKQIFLFVLLLTSSLSTKAQVAVNRPEQNNNPAQTGKEFQELKAGMVNQQLEAVLLNATRQEATAKKWNQQYTAVKIISGNWTEVKDASGKVIGRTLEAMVYGTGVAGNCNYQSFTFYQNFDGKTGDDKSTKISKIGQQHRCACAGQ